MFSGPQFWGEMFPFLAAGPSQGSPLFPHVQTESNCSHHWFKLERRGVLCQGRGNPKCPGGRILSPLALGKGGGGTTQPPCVLSPGPSHYCLKPHSSRSMEQVGRQEKGSGRIQGCE